jgi:hypothetical protein
MMLVLVELFLDNKLPLGIAIALFFYHQLAGGYAAFIIYQFIEVHA